MALSLAASRVLIRRSERAQHFSLTHRPARTLAVALDDHLVDPLDVSGLEPVPALLGKRKPFTRSTTTRVDPDAPVGPSKRTRSCGAADVIQKIESTGRI
jgi:hypothetical protein